MNLYQVRDWREPKWSVISNQKYPTDHSSDNALLFTATYIVHCDEPETEKDMFVKFADACQVVPGLFNRYPGSTSAEGWDDLIGIVAASVKLGLRYHKDILAWGERHSWTWNNQDPILGTLGSWLGRYPAFIPFLKMACDETCSPEEEALYIMANEASTMTPVGNESGKCLQYLMNKTVRGKHPEIDASIWLWGKLMSRKYASMAAVYSSYFGPAHPFSQFGPINFE